MLPEVELDDVFEDVDAVVGEGPIVVTGLMDVPTIYEECFKTL